MAAQFSNLAGANSSDKIDIANIAVEFDHDESNSTVENNSKNNSKKNSYEGSKFNTADPLEKIIDSVEAIPDVTDPIGTVLGHLRRTQNLEDGRPVVQTSLVSSQQNELSAKSVPAGAARVNLEGDTFVGNSSALQSLESLRRRVKSLPKQEIFFSRKEWTPDEVAEAGHLIVGDRVYDVSRFQHPGGSNIIEALKGKDATADFYRKHGRSGRHLRFVRLVGTVVESTETKAHVLAGPAREVSPQQENPYGGKQIPSAKDQNQKQTEDISECNNEKSTSVYT